MMSSSEKMGEYAFLAFVVIAIIAGLVIGGVKDLRTTYNNDAWVQLILVVLGIIVGLTTITEKESQPFLIAAIALAIASASNQFIVFNEILEPLGYIATYIVKYIAAFVIPAAVIMAIKAVYALARTR
jgi:hypothetical protein